MFIEKQLRILSADALTRDDNDMAAILSNTKQHNQFFNFPDLLNGWMGAPYLAESFPWTFLEQLNTKINFTSIP